MAGNIKIPVPGGIVGHGRKYDAVELRQPTFREIIDIGQVQELMIYPNGMRVVVTNSLSLERYIEACVIEPKDPLLIEQGGAPLALAIRDAIIGFFHPGQEPTPEP